MFRLLVDRQNKLLKLNRNIRNFITERNAAYRYSTQAPGKSVSQQLVSRVSE